MALKESGNCERFWRSASSVQEALESSSASVSSPNYFKSAGSLDQELSPEDVVPGSLGVEQESIGYWEVFGRPATAILVLLERS